jgi:hypothetical protein
MYGSATPRTRRQHGRASAPIPTPGFDAAPTFAKANVVRRDDGIAGPPLRFDAAEKRLVRACADGTGGG